MPDRVKERLSDKYEFEFRDHIQVKGIDAGMDVYLLKEGSSQSWMRWFFCSSFRLVFPTMNLVN